jgi:hypothetical protein
MTGHGGSPEEPSTVRGAAAEAEVSAELRPWVGRYGKRIGPAQFGLLYGRELMLSDVELVDTLAIARLWELKNGGSQGALYVERSRIDLVMGIEPEEHPGDAGRRQLEQREARSFEGR